MSLRQTHTYAVLEISQSAYLEIYEKLIEAGYEHAVGDDNTVDMHGIALTPEKPKQCEAIIEDKGYPTNPHQCSRKATSESRYCAQHSRMFESDRELT